MIINIIHTAFMVYTLILVARIISSWIPSFAHSKLVRLLAMYTDPYLNLFRKLIPPIGGVLDLSPLLAFFGLQLGEYALVYLVRMIA